MDSIAWHEHNEVKKDNNRCIGSIASHGENEVIGYEPHICSITGHKEVRLRMIKTDAWVQMQGMNRMKLKRIRIIHMFNCRARRE